MTVFPSAYFPCPTVLCEAIVFPSHPGYNVTRWSGARQSFPLSRVTGVVTLPGAPNRE